MKKIGTVLDPVDEVKLDSSFAKACRNEEFKKYVYNLKVEEDTLKKYTSSLEDSFLEYKNCLNCPGLDKCPNKVKGYCYKPEKESTLINFSYIACPKLEQELVNNAYQDNINLYEMPSEMKKASFKDLYKDDKARLPIIKYFKEFMNHYNDDNKPKGLYLNGSFGSGKTYLISALFNEMAKKGIRSAIVYYPEFLRGLKSSFQTDYNDKFNYIKKVPLLLLDDIGAENCSSWSRDEVLGPILQYRMESDLPTFFTSNLNLEELELSLTLSSSPSEKVKARRIVERVKQLSINIELISKNRRVK